MAGETNRRVQKIIMDLRKAPRTKEFLMEKYGIGLDMLNKDIKAVKAQLKEGGEDLSRHQKGIGYQILAAGNNADRTNPIKDSSVTRKTKQIQNTVYEQSMGNHMQKMILLLILQKAGKPLTMKEIEEAYWQYTMTGLRTESRERQQNRLRNMIDGSEKSGLIARGFISAEVNDQGETVYSLTKEAPTYLRLREETAMDIRELIESFRESYPFSKTLKSVEKKLFLSLISRETEENDDIEKEVSQFISSSKPRMIFSGREVRDQEIQKTAERLSHIPFERFPVRIVYEDADSRPFVFMTGLYLYSSDKDRLYLIGRKRGNTTDSILNAEKIISISVAEGKNTLYRNAYYLTLFDEMFSISIEPLTHVKVQFDNVFNIYQKLGTLQSFRKNSKVSKSADGKIIYEDDLRGLEDFAKYLRRYGRSVQVLEPAELKARMELTVIRMKERYGL